jgi:glycogen synthase
MNILFVTNFYPPHSVGGYEQWCQEVAQILSTRGHRVSVLTSRYGERGSFNDYKGVQVHRLLNLEVVGGLAKSIRALLLTRRRNEKENFVIISELVNKFAPDVALIWGMWNLPRSGPSFLESLLPGRVAYYFCDYWPTLPNTFVQQWQGDSHHQLSGIIKKIIKRPIIAWLNRDKKYNLQFRDPICVSYALKNIIVDAGIPILNARVIHGGTNIEEFKCCQENRARNNSNGKLKLLYVGRLSQEKGIKTAISSLDSLPEIDKRHVTLDVYGTGFNNNYEKYLRDYAASKGYGDKVVFHGSVPRQEIPTIMGKYHSLIFPSEWEEPFARTVLEAMASGLVVIGTTTGGTGEILRDCETGLTFKPGDADSLSRQISKLRHDQNLSTTLSVAGKRLVEENFTLEKMVDKFEITLTQLQANWQANPDHISEESVPELNPV